MAHVLKILPPKNAPAVVTFSNNFPNSFGSTGPRHEITESAVASARKGGQLAGGTGNSDITTDLM